MKKERVIKTFAEHGFSMGDMGNIIIERKNGSPVNLSFLSHTLGIVSKGSEPISMAYSGITSIDYNGKSLRIIFYGRVEGIDNVQGSLEIFVQKHVGCWMV